MKLLIIIPLIVLSISVSAQTKKKAETPKQDSVKVLTLNFSPEEARLLFNLARIGGSEVLKTEMPANQAMFTQQFGKVICDTIAKKWSQWFPQPDSIKNKKP